QSQNDSPLDSRRRQIEPTDSAAASVPSSCLSRKRSNTRVRFLRFSLWILREDGSTDKVSSRKDSIGRYVGLGSSRAFFLDFSVNGLLSRIIKGLIIKPLIMCLA